MITTVDENFIKRVYISTIVVWSVGVWVAFSTWGLNESLGWTLGCLLSLWTVRSIEWIVRRVFIPGAKDAKSSLVKYTLLKIPFALSIIILVIYLGKKDFGLIGAFCIGAVAVQIVIVLKVAGMLINKAINK